MASSSDSRQRRARRFAALGDPVRLAIVEDLVVSDCQPLELARRHDLGSNLLAHHLDILESAGLIGRSVSAGDRRRRYVRANLAALAEVQIPVPSRAVLSADAGRVVFVCTAATARSQLAAALWRHRTNGAAAAMGTDPAAAIHPATLAAARRAGLDLDGAQPRAVDDEALGGDVVVTVCDRAHEALGAQRNWRHWSVPDPVVVGTSGAFDDCVAELTARIDVLAGVA